MTASTADTAMAEFDGAFRRAKTPDEAYRRAANADRGDVGVKLFTVMTVDMDGGLARRAYTSDPEDLSGLGHQADPFRRLVRHRSSRQRRNFVANTLEDIAKVFPDHELIGCARLPVGRQHAGDPAR